jgi:hypothetical protein
MGSKSSSAPPPDPRLVEAQIQSLGIQGDAIQRIMAQAEALAPLQREQMQFGLDAAKTAYTQSQSDRAYSLERRDQLTGLQNKAIEDAKSFDADTKGSEYAARGVADVSRALDGAQQAQARQQQRMGVNPSSGKAQELASQMGVTGALAKATAANAGRTQARDEGYRLTDRATNVLSGYPSMGMATTGSGLQTGGAGLTLVQQGLSGLQSGNQSALSGAGAMGSNATGMFNAQANYKLQSDQLANSKNDGLFGALGTLGGAAIQAGMFSDPRLKKDVRKVADDPRGFGWYEYEYVWGGGRMTGVMADEVQAVMPEAIGQVGRFLTVDYSKL